MSIWRIGFVGAPCEFAPLHLYAWDHRFDDPERQYRTIYGAAARETCFREILADLRENKKATGEFRKLFGDDAELKRVAGLVTKVWQRRNVLVRAKIVLASGELVVIESPGTLKSLRKRLALPDLDAAAVRGKDRDLTRRISRLFFDEGKAGIEFISRLDEKPCTALFEGRAFLRQEGDAIVLSQDVPELVAVCAAYGLTLA